MKPIPATKDALVLRADFSDDTEWQAVCEAIQAPVGEFQAYVEFLSDREYDGIGVDQLLSLIPQESSRHFMFVIDRTTLSQPDHPILCVNLYDQPGRTFRVIPSEMWSVENNLSLANMDFHEFANAVDPDGVFRGFGDMPDYPSTVKYATLIQDGLTIRFPI